MIKRVISIALLCVMLCATLIICVSADGNPKISVSSASAYAGEEVIVTVSLDNNPGIATLKLSLSYDSSALKLVLAEDMGGLGSAMFSNSYNANPFVLAWNISSIADNDYTTTGAIAKLKFKVLDTAKANKYDVSLTCRAGEAFNANLQTYTPQLVSGSITVKGNDTECSHKTCVWEIIQKASCSASGTKNYKCSNCGFIVKTETIEKESHKIKSQVVEATCKAEGYTVFNCQNCSYSYKSEQTPKVKHSVKQWITTLKPTKDSEGRAEGVCDVCKEKISKVLPKLGGQASTKPSESSDSEAVSSRNDNISSFTEQTSSHTHSKHDYKNESSVVQNSSESLQSVVSEENDVSNKTPMQNVTSTEHTSEEELQVNDTASETAEVKDNSLGNLFMVILLGLLILSVAGRYILKYIKKKK